MEAIIDTKSNVQTVQPPQSIPSSDDEAIGVAAEQEYNNDLSPKSKRERLTNGQRLKLIDDFRNGKVDKFYNVIPDKKCAGSYRIIRRRKPLDVPVADSNPVIVPVPQASAASVPTTPSKPACSVNEPPKMNIEFYASMQNSINSSLSKEIAACMEKCLKIEAKMKKQKEALRERDKHVTMPNPTTSHPTSPPPPVVDEGVMRPRQEITNIASQLIQQAQNDTNYRENAPQPAYRTFRPYIRRDVISQLI